MRKQVFILLLAGLSVLLLIGLAQPCAEPEQKQPTATLTPKEFLKQELFRNGFTNRDFSILEAVFFCESSWEQRYEDGTVKVSNGNIGLAQINRFAHEIEYTKLGLDPYDDFQNLKYAIILYKRNGVRDWLQWSGHCFVPLLAQQGIIIK